MKINYDFVEGFDKAIEMGQLALEIINADDKTKRRWAETMKVVEQRVSAYEVEDEE